MNSADDSSDYLISTCNTLDSIQNLKEEWNTLHQDCSSRSLYNSFDFIYTSVQYFSQPTDQLFFILIRAKSNQQLLAIFPFNLADYSWRKGVFRAVTLTAREESDKVYPVIQPGLEIVMWSLMLDYIKSQKSRWDFLDLEEIREDCHAVDEIKTSFSKGYLIRVNADAISPIVDLSTGWEEFWDKHPKMRKKVRKIESTFANEFRFEVLSDENAISDYLMRYIELEKRSWKPAAKIGIGRSDNSIEFYRDYFSILAKQQSIWFGFMYKGERLVSAEIAYACGTTVYFAHGCYDSEYKSLSPGMVSTCLFLKHFFNKGYVEGDFLGGFAKYINPWASRLLPSNNIIVIKLSLKTVYYYIRNLFRRAFMGRLKRQ